VDSRIVHVVEAWKGGISTYVKNLLEMHKASGDEVFVIGPINVKDDIVKWQYPNVSFVEYSPSRNPFSFLKIASDIKNKINEVNPDVVFLHSTFPGVYGRLGAGKSNKDFKTIYIPHSWSFLKRDVNKIIRAIYKRVEVFLSHRCSKIVVMSLEEYKVARSAGIKSDILELIYTGINFDKVTSSEILTFSSDKLCVAFVGRFDYQKGFDILSQVIKKSPEQIEFHILGDSVRNNFIVPETSNTVYYGWQPQNKVYDVIAAADILLLPSRWEGFALAPVESMLLGTPVIVSSETSLHELVIDEFNGLIIQSLEPEIISAMLPSISKERCIEMGINAKSVARKVLNHEVFYKKIKGLYE